MSYSNECERMRHLIDPDISKLTNKPAADELIKFCADCGIEIEALVNRAVTRVDRKSSK